MILAAAYVLAVASAVLVTTCTDVIGFFLFLGLATALVSYLL